MTSKAPPTDGREHATENGVAPSARKASSSIFDLARLLGEGSVRRSFSKGFQTHAWPYYERSTADR